MITLDVTSRPRLKHHGKAKVVRERYQRPKIQDLGKKWKVVYWDYSTGAARKRSKVWPRRLAQTRREAQRLADSFIEQVNERNNDLRLLSFDNNTLAGLHQRCKELIWKHLKNSTLIAYEYHFNHQLIPALGARTLREITTIELQIFFNGFHPRMAAKTIRNLHAALRAALNQAVAWGMIDRNPAIGVRLPRKRMRKPPILLSLADLKRLLDALPEPSRSVVVLIVLGSMRVGEVLALRWKDILADRVIVDERVYEGVLDEVKTDSGNREIPFDRSGLIQAALTGAWQRSRFRNPEDFVFATSTGRTLERRNLLNRHIKPTVARLGLDASLDFRSFRTMHSSLMRRTGARPEIVRDNMGHSDVDITLDVYSKSWWEERADAVSEVAELLQSSGTDSSVFQSSRESNRALLFTNGPEVQLEPQLEPHPKNGAFPG
jgi:integrase